VIVVDASALVEWLLRLPAGDQVEERLRRADAVHAPHLVTVEVTQVIRRLVLADRMPVRRGEEALADLVDLELTLHAHDVLVSPMWRLRHHLTAYDAAYVALSQVLAAPLVTLDRHLAAAPIADTRIDLVAG
jgi:predicted nucleic acid-binding protein